MDIEARSSFPILWSYDIKDRIREFQRGAVWLMPVCIPWALLAPHEKQAQANHSQTLTRLAERGGLSPCEALAVLDDRPYSRMPITQSCAELAKRIVAWNEETPDANHP